MAAKTAQLPHTYFRRGGIYLRTNKGSWENQLTRK